ncbi:MAG: NADH-quinone oxidoreductase subunit F, partial [Candidatus Marinimicrobia bacterium]|nr:NADH-quinone oxidoreductase subunit F [Candidatus Neomarinimicrobiota bacterium]
MKNKILVCVGTSGLAAGADDVVNNFKNELKKHKLLDEYKVVETGDKGLFVDVIVEIIDSNGATYINVKPKDVEKIFESHIVNKELYKKRLANENYNNFFKNQERIVLKNCGVIDPENIEDYLEYDGYKALKKTLEKSQEYIVNEVTESGLRGRGGGGFSTGTKWGFGKKAESDTKYIICNADEGDPGAFMDRSVLESDPHAILEGMAIAGYAIGANFGYIYCRAEYPLAIKRLNIAIKQAKEKGFIGENIFGSGFTFNLKIKAGAGAFVCGEETALIASIEGHRGRPKTRPPFPAVKGLFGKPTVINNVETLANIRHIIMNGSKWFASKGTKDSAGTKVFALAGKIKNTGLVEVPMGTTI